VERRKSIVESCYGLLVVTMNQTRNLDSTAAISEMVLWATTTTYSALNDVSTVLTNTSQVTNITEEIIPHLDCGTFVMEYGIIACIIYGAAFIIGIVFCFFGE